MDEELIGQIRSILVATPYGEDKCIISVKGF